MGVINVTPDSFSDGGQFAAQNTSFSVSIDKVLRQAESMVASGAALLDVGGESTRPGARPVSEQEELDRVIPVVEAIAGAMDVIISIDTSTPSVITAGAAAGAGMVNDVRALQREGALAAAAASNMAVCLMHMQGQPSNMQDQPRYRNVLDEVDDFLSRRVISAEAAGIDRSRLCIDPGFGFGKSDEHNYHLLAHLSYFRGRHKLPVLVGISRKSMIGRIVDRPVDQRLAGSLAAAVIAAANGADIIRVHDVPETVDAMRVLTATAQHS
jgi:dihydropteroate synthase